MQGFERKRLFVSHVIRMVFSNMPRLILSICGLFVGLFILTLGILLMNSYYDECMSKANQFADNTIAVQLEGDGDKLTEFIEKCNNNNNVAHKMISLDSRTIYIKKYTNNEYCYLKTRIVGTTDMSDNMILGKFDDSMYLPYKAELVYGRQINDSDLANEEKVVIIDEFTSRLLFGMENPIGKSVMLDVTAEGTTVVSNVKDKTQDSRLMFKVIGVYANKKITKDNEKLLEKFKNNGDEDLMLETMIYIPMTVYTQIYDEGENYYVVECSNSQNYYNTLSFIEDYKSIHGADFYKFNLIIKSDVIESLENDLKPLKVFMWIILLFLLLLSGVNSMNTMFFSIKERMGEIGIKKSLGASKWNITLQFMMEGITMALLAGMIAIIGGIFVGGVIGNIVQSVMYVNFTVTYSSEIIYVPLTAAGIYGIVFSFLPSYYGANIKVTDALRFE